MNISKVMVVDDSEADQLIAEMQIKNFDPSIELLQAFDGSEAFEILDELDKQPDVILLDINMPGMDGHEFLAKYSEKDNQSVVVAMLTSSDQEKDKEQVLKYDFVKEYFLKTLDSVDMERLKKL